MAVYKAMYCYPFLNAVDIRVTSDADFEATAQYLSCRVDSSNKDVTGYRIRLLDEHNNQIFPIIGAMHGTETYDDKVSPIVELEGLFNDSNINSGMNGTYLKIPFFQTYNNRIVNSYNNIYYKAAIYTDRILDMADPSAQEKWMYDATNHKFYIREDESGIPVDVSTIDGETPADGQRVLIINNTDKSRDGLYYVQVVKKIVDDQDVFSISLISMSQIHTLEINDLIVCYYGEKFKNKVYKYNGGDAENVFTEYKGNLWCDIFGNEIKELSTAGLTYKWEITLYQGDVEPEEDTINQILYMNYSHLDDEWFDAKLTSGKILGSTPKRIQIADADEEILPTSTTEDPLILQTRFMALSNRDPGTITSSLGAGSIYVETYDEIYGHIYPRANTTLTQDIDRYNSCQFFKHSTNPEEILNTDIVDFGFSRKAEIKFYDGGSITSNLIYTESSSDLGQIIEQYQIGNGQLFLITDAYNNNDVSAPERNGVYYWYEKEATVGSIDNCYLLKRAASYSDWAAFIGKVIYCRAGSYQGQNIESLANGGTFTLWNPLAVGAISGSSPLFFRSEEPILLFGSKIAHTFFAYDAQHDHPQTAATRYPITIDYENVRVGDVILYKDNNYRVVAGIENNQYWTASEGGGIVTNNSYVQFTNGKTYGHYIYKTIGQVAISGPNYDLYTARILHNTKTTVFISPYENLEVNMKLKLTNNKIFKYANSNDYTSWIVIREINKVLWKITIDEVTTPFKSYDRVDQDIPWSYEVRTFFKASDENPFYAYEMPYITLEVNGDPYENFIEKLHTIPFVVRQADDEEVYYVRERDDSNLDIPFLVREYEASSGVNGRSVSLKANYIQKQGVSWESYRWILLEEDPFTGNGIILQDTGKQYNKNIEVQFFGLANDSDINKVYYVILYIEDQLNNVLQYTIKLIVNRITQETGDETYLIPFTASFDCATQSVLLDYKDIAIVKPSYLHKNGVTSTSQVWDAVNRVNYSEWDGSVYYSGDSTIKVPNAVYITGTNYDENIPNYVTETGETINKGDLIPESSSASKTSTNGLVYSNYFEKSENNVPISEWGYSGRILTLNAQDKDINNSGSFSFATKVAIDPNHCGDIVSVDVEGSYDEGNHPNPVILDNGDPILKNNQDKTLEGYLTFSVYIPEDFDSNSWNLALNPNRNKIGFKILKDNGRSGDISEYFSNIERFSLENLTSTYYIANYTDSEIIDENIEFLHYNLGTDSSHQKHMSFIPAESGLKTSLNKFLGNMCLVGWGYETQYTTKQTGFKFEFDAETMPRLSGGKVYWDERLDNMIFTDSVDESNNAIHYISNDNLLWGGESGEKEQESYWLEDSECEPTGLPTLDKELNSGTFDNFKAFPRHPNANQDYQVRMEINNIQYIYNNFASMQIVDSQTAECLGTITIIDTKNSVTSNLYIQRRAVAAKTAKRKSKNG